MKRRSALEKRLEERGLQLADVIDADGIRRLAGIEHLRHQNLQSLPVSLGLRRMPRALFATKQGSYWSYEEILAWLAPFLTSERPAVSREALREEVLRRYAAGADDEEIAADYDLDPTLVRQWVDKSDVPRRKKPLGRPLKERGRKLAVAIDLYASGMSSWKASRLAGMSQSDFRDAVHAAGVKVRPAGGSAEWRKHSAETRRLGVALAQRGRSINSIAKEFGVTWPTVRRWVDDDATARRLREESSSSSLSS